jgi:NitT/TauT family transport system substrate-binding protein
MDADTAGGQTAAHQKRMMSEIAKLAVPAAKGMGYLEPAAYQRTVEELMSGGSDPVITKVPEGAYTYAIWEKAVSK